MSNQTIEPGKVTKPIQLVAAWLVGLILVNGAFLITSTGVEEPIWLKATLVFAAIINVPLFLGAIFLLQTKFRPQLQEDSFYSKYLDSKTNQLVTKSKYEAIEAELLQIKNISHKNVVTNISCDKKEILANYNIGLNDRIDSFKEIRSLLKGRGIPLNTIFGSIATTEKPDKMIFTLSNSLDFNGKIAAIRLGFECGADGYNYYDPYEEMSEEDILIGSYGYHRGYTALSKQLEELINNNPDPVDLSYFEKVNTSKKF